MLVSFDTLNGHALTMDCTLPQFLAGPVMSHLAARQNDCDPADIVRDHLVALDGSEDDDEIAERVEEACLAAVSVAPVYGVGEAVAFATVTGVRVADEDLSAVRRLARGAPVEELSWTKLLPAV